MRSTRWSSASSPSRTWGCPRATACRSTPSATRTAALCRGPLPGCPLLGARPGGGGRGPRRLEELQGSDIEAGPVAIATPAFLAAHEDEACSVGVFASAHYASGGGPSDAEMTAATRRAAPAHWRDRRRVHRDRVPRRRPMGGRRLRHGAPRVRPGDRRRRCTSPDPGRGPPSRLPPTGSTRPSAPWASPGVSVALAVAVPLVVASAAGAGLAVLGLSRASPLFPRGVARRAEPEPGVLADGWVLAIGAVLLVRTVALTAVLACAAHCPASRGPGPGVLRGRCGGSLGGVAAGRIGVRLVGDRSRGRFAVRTAVVGAAVGGPGRGLCRGGPLRLAGSTSRASLNATAGRGQPVRTSTVTIPRRPLLATSVR